jgi:hypothetical protein
VQSSADAGRALLFYADLLSVPSRGGGVARANACRFLRRAGGDRRSSARVVSTERASQSELATRSASAQLNLAVAGEKSGINSRARVQVER